MTRSRAAGIGLLLTLFAVGLWLTPEPGTPSTKIEWVGCTRTIEGPICSITETATLTLWIPNDDEGACGTAEISIDGHLRATAGTPVDAGRRYKVVVEPGSTRLAVAGCGQRPAWQLRIERHTTNPEVERVDALRRRDPERARSQLKLLSGATVGERVSLEARIVASTEGIDAAAPLFRRAIAALEEEGALSQACDTRLAFAFFSTEDLRLDDARDTLDGGNRCESVSPMHRAVWPNYRAIVSLETMDVRSALRWVDDAILHQRRLGLDARLFLSVEQKARLLRSVGRFEDAASLLNRTLPEDALCQRAVFANQRAWTAMMAAEAQRPLLETSAVEQLFAAALKDAPACGSQVSPFIRLNLAFLHVELHRADDAEAELLRAEAELTGDDARTRAWRMELRGHIARLRGQPEVALDAFARLDAFGAARADEQARWRAALGRGRTLEIMERWEDAVEAYRAAERSVDRQLALVPFGEGRASFADARSPGTLRLLNVLLRLKRTEEAAAVTRRSLRRSVGNLVRASRLAALDPESRARWESLLADYQRHQRSLQGDAASTWQLADEESNALHEQMAAIRASLRETLDAKLASAASTDARRPGPDEALLVLHPLDRESWAAFALTVEGTTLIRTASPSDVVEALADVLRAKREIVIVAPGALEGIDFHALDLDGRPLGATRSVRYGLDLPTAATSVSVPRSALVARDRTGTLRNADREEAAVRDALATTSVGRTPSAVYEALASADHFHFAGHGQSAGPDGIESALRISEHLQITTSDILHLPRVPKTVVLAGCDLARTEPLATTLTLGAAQAFVVRGAQRVVAAVRPVADEDAVRFARLFYAAMGEAASFDDAFRSAQQSLREAAPDSDWAAFRVVGP